MIEPVNPTKNPEADIAPERIFPFDVSAHDVANASLAQPSIPPKKMLQRDRIAPEMEGEQLPVCHVCERVRTTP